MALAGVWNTNFLGMPDARGAALLERAAPAARRTCSSSRWNRTASASTARAMRVSYATCPVVWGAEGTVEPAFVPPAPAPGNADRAVRLHRHLGSERNLSARTARAQADALAFGSDDRLPPYRHYPGNRPSSMLYLEKFDARNLGRLLALYEHKVFAQGVIWNINSFDQWGVELGKEHGKEDSAQTEAS